MGNDFDFFTFGYGVALWEYGDCLGVLLGGSVVGVNFGEPDLTITRVEGDGDFCIFRPVGFGFFVESSVVCDNNFIFGGMGGFIPCNKRPVLGFRGFSFEVAGGFGLGSGFESF